MKEIKDLVLVNDYCKGFNLSTLHPLVTILDLSEGNFIAENKARLVRYHFYGVFLKQGDVCVMKYGRQNYDYQDGTLVFVAPGQLVNITHLPKNYKPAGYALLFHPDLIRGTNLGNNIDTHSFFSYELNEALHLSQLERQIVLDCFDKIRFELTQGIDKYSKRVIVSNIELFLNYCARFYGRQFITRDSVNLGIIQKFESSLNTYILSGKIKEMGTPTVSYFAKEQHLSPNYFGDLIKKETGKSAQEHIQLKLVNVAKNLIYNSEKSISEIAYELGFKYPQHFNRMFKKAIGQTPSEYRNLN